MKLASLNTWGAAQGPVLFDYLASLAHETDVFCLQEVFAAMPPAPQESHDSRLYQLQELQQALPEFRAFFAGRSFGFDESGEVEGFVNSGLALFIKKSATVERYASYALGDSLKIPGTNPVEGIVVVQVAELSLPKGAVTVVNFHGVSRPGTKVDTSERILQSQRLLELLSTIRTPVVLCGDFNLLPDTASVRMLEGKLRNLITEYSIQNTRNEISWAKHPHAPKQHFADFTFVSQGMKVQNFEVPYNEVSDHLPMLLSFDIE